MLHAAALALSVSALLSLAASALVRRLGGRARAVALLASLLALLVAALVFLPRSGPFFSEAPEPPLQSEAAAESLSRRSALLPAAPAKLLEGEAGVKGDAGGESYQGLPAKIDIPPGATHSVFTRELLATDAPGPVLVVMIATRTLSDLTAAAVLLLLVAAAILRRELLLCARIFLSRLLGAPAVTTGR
jgi:hypothetical protein